VGPGGWREGGREGRREGGRERRLEGRALGTRDGFAAGMTKVEKGEGTGGKTLRMDGHGGGGN